MLCLNVVAIEIIVLSQCKYEFKPARSPLVFSAEMVKEIPSLVSAILTCVFDPIFPTSGNNTLYAIVFKGFESSIEISTFFIVSLENNVYNVFIELPGFDNFSNIWPFLIENFRTTFFTLYLRNVNIRANWLFTFGTFIHIHHLSYINPIFIVLLFSSFLYYF